MDKRRDVAREIARIYCRLSPSGVEALSEILVPFKYAKGDVVLPEGDICKHMYFVERGMVRQYYYKNGRDVTEHFSYEGRIVVCIESFLKQEPSRLIVEALENSLLFGIPYDELHELADKNKEIELLFRKIMEHALISSQIYADSQRFENATERYLRLLDAKPEILLRAPMLHIASYLQMSPETLSRVRAAHITEEVEKERSERSKKEQLEASRAEMQRAENQKLSDAVKSETQKSDSSSHSDIVKQKSESLKSESMKPEGKTKVSESKKEEEAGKVAKGKKSAE